MWKPIRDREMVKVKCPILRIWIHSHQPDWRLMLHSSVGKYGSVLSHLWGSKSLTTGFVPSNKPYK